MRSVCAQRDCSELLSGGLLSRGWLLDGDGSPALVVAAGWTDVVRQPRVPALRTLRERDGIQVVVASPVALACSGRFSLWYWRHRTKLLFLDLIVGVR
jgi:hypothetical protein